MADTEEQDAPPSAQQQCSKCHLAKHKPTIPMYAPYSFFHDMDPNKTYRWCSCGLSKTQPWCDNTHLEQRGEDGKPLFKPVIFKVPPNQSYFQLCGCKYTKKPPYCDGTHSVMPFNPQYAPCKCPATDSSLQW